MNSRKAFTLIELLVVIAIIAILAAILFPVFAQAKAAAKKSSSLSNVKQTGLSSIIYQADYDDIMPIINEYGQTGVNNGAYVYFGNRGVIPWTQLIQPYMKNVDILMDPQGPQPLASPAGFNVNVSKLFTPMYGYNPYLIQGGVSYPYSAGGGTLHNPRSQTAIGRVADTVMFQQKYANSEHASNNFYSGYYYGPGTFFIGLSTDPPNCYDTGNLYYCAAGWGDNGFYGGTGGLKLLKNVEAAGAWTGGASLRGMRTSVAVFCDGHAAVKPPGYFAEGTNYNGAKNAAGIPIQLETQVAVTDISRERYMGL
ncbi:MAG: prepilin-type N-terminal cleavage/methylation domain-containing protein [Chlorobia bacterium]|nr:prepilin-type N-terminal cleavage/methylation domain-containing protein [Fimbriimonadaceae bacterium]